MTLEHGCPPRQAPLRPRQGGYDQIPSFVQQREDIPGGAKRLYGLLQSVQRMKIEPDYEWLAAELAASVRSIVRWVKRLSDVSLIAVRRRGQGLTNIFRVLALVTSGTDTVTAAAVTQGQDRPVDLSKKKENRNNRIDLRAPGRDFLETSEGWRVKPRT